MRKGARGSPTCALGWVDRKTHFGGSGSGRKHGLINMSGLDKAGNVVHIGEGESAVGGSGGDVVEFFDDWRTGEGK